MQRQGPAEASWKTRFKAHKLKPVAGMRQSRTQSRWITGQNPAKARQWLDAPRRMGSQVMAQQVWPGAMGREQRQRFCKAENICAKDPQDRAMGPWWPYWSRSEASVPCPGPSLKHPSWRRGIRSAYVLGPVNFRLISRKSACIIEDRGLEPLNPVRGLELTLRLKEKLLKMGTWRHATEVLIQAGRARSSFSSKSENSLALPLKEAHRLLSLIKRTNSNNHADLATELLSNSHRNWRCLPNLTLVRSCGY